MQRTALWTQDTALWSTGLGRLKHVRHHKGLTVSAYASAQCCCQPHVSCATRKDGSMCTVDPRPKPNPSPCGAVLTPVIHHNDLVRELGTLHIASPLEVPA